jgi:hypothetical protein
MTEQDLVELGFNRFDESAEVSGTSEDWYYYSFDIGGLNFISNASDEWDVDGIWVELMDTDFKFKGSGDLWVLREILFNNM